MDPKNKTTLLLIFVTVSLDILGFSMIIPVLPFYATEFGAGPAMIGTLVGSYAAAQFVATIYAGRASDRWGRKALFLTSLLGGCIGSLGQGFAWDLGSLVFFRTLTGLFGMSPPVAFAAVADLSTPAERPKLIASVGASMGLAFLCGPVISAGLVYFLPLSAPFFAACISGAVAFVFAAIYVNETNPTVLKRRAAEKAGVEMVESNMAEEEEEGEKDGAEEEEEGAEKEEEEEEDEVGDPPADEDEIIVTIEKEPQSEAPEKKMVPRKLGIFLICCLACAVRLNYTSLGTLCGLYLADTFDASASLVGLVFSAFSLFALPCQLLGFPFLSKRLKMPVVSGIGCSLAMTGVMMFALAQKFFVVGIGMAFLAGGLTLVAPSVQCLMSSLSTASDRGKILSYGESAASIARVGGPFIMGGIYELSSRAPWWCISGFTLVFGVGSMSLLLWFGWNPVEAPLEKPTAGGEEEKGEAQGENEEAQGEKEAQEEEVPEV